ncbi:MAG: alkaline phosphatase family protein [Alphaproteobacteria bacterium]|nr:alkaline phosphatase family protein [Alphaproteobacteria bacterium]
MYNALLITADQWRAECLSALGHPTVKTPNLDALAAEGTLFRNHFGQCTPCGPSRASLLTGMYTMNHRSVRNGTPLDRRFTTIALEMRRLGYAPALIGYTDTGTDPRGLDPNDPALKTYAGTLPGFTQLVPGSEGEKAWRRYLAKKGYDFPPVADAAYQPVTNYARGPGWGPTFAPAPFKAEDSDTAFATDAAIDYVTHETKPWFLHLSLLRPHPPFVAPEPYNAMYDPATVPGFKGLASRDEEARQHPYMAYMMRDFRDHKREGHAPGLHRPEERAMRQLRATYYGLMSEVDHHLGRLMAALRRTGADERTLVVFASDHGEQLWDHWALGKEFYFDQSYHIPLIVRPPAAERGSARGRVVDAFTESIDVMPTILDCLGAAPPVQCDGASLKPWLAGATPASWREEVFFELDFRDAAEGAPERELGMSLDECTLAVVRDRRYKYVHFAALPPLLFDLASDPEERRNCLDDPAHAPAALAMAQKMLTWRLAMADRALTGLKLSSKGLVECPPGRRIAAARFRAAPAAG